MEKLQFRSHTKTSPLKNAPLIFTPSGAEQSFMTTACMSFLNFVTRFVGEVAAFYTARSAINRCLRRSVNLGFSSRVDQVLSRTKEKIHFWSMS